MDMILVKIFATALALSEVMTQSQAVKTQSGSAQLVVAAPASGGGGGGGIDILTLLATFLAVAWRRQMLRSALRYPLRHVEPFFLRPAIVRRRNACLLQ